MYVEVVRRQVLCDFLHLWVLSGTEKDTKQAHQPDLAVMGLSFALSVQHDYNQGVITPCYNCDFKWKHYSATAGTSYSFLILEWYIISTSVLHQRRLINYEIHVLSKT